MACNAGVRSIYSKSFVGLLDEAALQERPGRS